MNTDEKTIDLLRTAYCMELETIMNYLANSVNLDGVRAEEIKKSLAADVTEELLHAQQLAQRMKQLGGLVPGSAAVTLGGQMQPSALTTDVVHVIKSVIAAEEAAIKHYKSVTKPPTAKTTSRKTSASAYWLMKKYTSCCFEASSKNMRLLQRDTPILSPGMKETGM